MASEVLCGRCGTLLTNPGAPCPRCGAPASGAWQYAPASGAAAPWPYARRKRKDPRIAALLAVIPGMGHFYLGHNAKGFGYLAGVGLLSFFGFDLDLSVIGAAIGVPMELGGGTLWLYGIIDAYRTAKRMEAEGGS